MAFAISAQILPKIGSVIFVLTCIVLIGVILLQKGRGGGLSGAFGGAGGHTAFGAKTGDFLTWTTVVLATAFLLLAVVMNFAFRPPRVVTQPPPTPAEGQLDLPDTGLPAEGAPVPSGEATPGEAFPEEQPPGDPESGQPVEQPSEPAGSDQQPVESPDEKAEEPRP